MKNEYYLTLAKEVSKASKCLRSHFGVIIIKNDMIIGTGYNGPARGVQHCDPCKRADDPPGIGYEKCIAVHAEANAIIQAGGRERCLGASMYIGSHNRRADDSLRYNNSMDFFPCNNCGRLIINSGIKQLIQLEGENIRCYDISFLVAMGQLK